MKNCCGDRLVETVKRAQVGDVGFGLAPGGSIMAIGIAGRDADDDEHDDRHAEQRDQRSSPADQKRAE